MSVRAIAAVVSWLAVACGAIAGQSHVTGAYTFGKPIAPPPGAVFEAVLDDVSRIGAGAVARGRTETADPGPSPYGLVIDYGAAAIDSRHLFALRSGLVAGVRTRFASAGIDPAITRGAPDRVEIELVQAPVGRGPGARKVVSVTAQGEDTADDGAAPPMRGLVTYLADVARFTDCRTGELFPIAMEGDYQALEHAYLAAGQEPGAPVMASFEGSIVERPRMDGGGTGPAVLVGRFVGVWPGEECKLRSEPASLTDTYWRIVRLGEREISPAGDRREPHFVLRPADQRFVATVGCNQLVGSFELAGDKLMFGQAAATRMVCPPPLDAWEQQLGWVLSATARWQIDGQTLELYDADGTALATLRAVYLP